MLAIRLKTVRSLGFDSGAPGPDLRARHAPPSGLRVRFSEGHEAQ